MSNKALVLEYLAELGDLEKLPPHVPQKLHSKSAIRTFTGRSIDPFDMTANDVDMIDIVIGLAHTARYNGHSFYTYTVAQHSCLLYDWAKEQGLDLNTQRWFLLHDATEIYVSDIPRPIKRHPEIKKVFTPLELRVMQCIAQRFALDGTEPEIVTEMDFDILASEILALQPYGALTVAETWPEGPKHIFNIEEWTPQRARSEYSARILEAFSGSNAFND